MEKKIGKILAYFKVQLTAHPMNCANTPKGVDLCP